MEMNFYCELDMTPTNGTLHLTDFAKVLLQYDPDNLEIYYDNDNQNFSFFVKDFKILNQNGEIFNKESPSYNGIFPNVYYIRTDIHGIPKKILLEDRFYFGNEYRDLAKQYKIIAVSSKKIGGSKIDLYRKEYENIFKNLQNIKYYKLENEFILNKHREII